MKKTVLIRGDGIAACCSAHLLRGVGFQIIADPSPRRPKLPAIMIGLRTQQLIEDSLERPNLFQNFLQVRRRVVCWGPQST